MEISKVAFLGFADAKPNDWEYEQAFQSAKILAENGYEIVNGGGPGIMRAATDGAHAGGGKLPGGSVGATIVGSGHVVGFRAGPGFCGIGERLVPLWPALLHQRKLISQM